MAETGELVTIAVAVVGAIGAIGGGLTKWLSTTFGKYQDANVAIAQVAQADSIKSREEFSKAIREHAELTRAIEANHADIHERTMVSLERIERSCHDRSDEDRKTILYLAGLEKTDTGSFRKRA